MNSKHRLSKKTAFALISIVCGFLAALCLLELVCRLLPVSDSLKTQPVNRESPILHFLPDRELLLSQGALFQIRARKRTNNYGYLADVDYRPSGRPKMVVIGDSYVEARQIENSRSMHGLLHAIAAENSAEVYGIGSAGSALPQYLAYARYALEEFEPASLCIVIIGNDFDESLAAYKTEPGFHYFKKTDRGYQTVRLDFEPTVLTRFLRSFALVRYLYLNVCIDRIRFALPLKPHDSPAHVGNVARHADHEKILRSREAVDFFLESLAAVAGGIPVLFVVDGLRPALYEDENCGRATASYFADMRSYFQFRAQEKNFEVIDLNPIFCEHFHATGERLEFPGDGHWNERGHRLAAQAVAQSETFRR